MTAAQLNIKIASEGAQRAAADVRDVGNAVETTGQQSTTAASRFSGAGQTLRGVGLGMTAAITAPILALGVGIVGMASDTNEALSAVKNVYGTAADGVIRSSQGAATAVGLSQTQYLSATTNLAAYGKMMGLTQGQTATFADQTVSAAADLASFYNTSPEDAMSAINAGFRGEGDALEKYGIIMNQATVEQYALTSGIWDGNGAMTNAQLVQARSGYIMSQLTDETGSANAAMGDFTETSGGLANQQRILKARLLDVGASFGQVLLPIALKMVGVFGKVIGGLSAMSPAAKTVTVVIAAIAAAIGPLLIVFGSLLGAVGSVAAAFGTGGMLAWLTPLLGPIALVVAALVGLGIAYKTNFLGFGDAVRDVGSKIKDIFGQITDTVDDLTDAFRFFRIQGADPVQAALGALANVFPALRGVIVPVADAIARFTSGFQLLRDDGLDPVTAALGALGMAFPALQDVINPLLGAVSRLKDAFAEDGLMGVLKAIPGLVLDAIAGLAGMAVDLGGWVLNVAVPAVGGWLLGGLTALATWIFGALGDAAGLVLDFVGWTLAVAMPTVGGWLVGGATGVIDWIKGRLGIGSVAASPDGIPTGGGDSTITWGGWVLSVAAPMVGGWLAGGASAILDWIKGKLGIGSVAASPDGIPTGSGDSTIDWGGWSLNVLVPALTKTWDFLATVATKIGEWAIAAAGWVIHWGGWSVAVEWATVIVKGTWDFIVNVAGKLAEWAIAAVGYVLHWGGWSVTVDWATDVVKGAWDFLTNVASAIWEWVKGVAGYVLTWAGWSVTVGWATDVAKGAWDFITNVAVAIWGWIQDAAGYTIEWAGWILKVGPAAVANGLGVIVDWLQPYIDTFIGNPTLTLLNYTLSLGAPSNGIGLSADFNWTELAKAAFTGTITLDPKIQIDIFKMGQSIGSWINGALQDPRTWALIGIGLAALAVAIFVGPEALLLVAVGIGIAAAKQPMEDAFAALFAGIADGLDLSGLFSGILTKITDGLATVLDGIAAVLGKAPDWAVPDGLIGEIRGWSDDLKGVGSDLGADFRSGFTGAIAGDDPNRDNPGGMPPVDPAEASFRVRAGGGASNRKAVGAPDLGDLGSLTGGGGMFGGFIAAATEAKTAFAEVMTGITTSSAGAKTGVVAALTGMQTEGLPPVAGLSATSLGHLLAMQLGGNAQATALKAGVIGEATAMQLGASASAGLTKDDVSTKLGAMKGTGIGHATALSAQTILAFNNMKIGAIVAAATTSSDVVTKLGTMASGGSAKATELMNNVKDRIRNSGAADTAYSVGYNIGSSLSGGLSAWLGTIQNVAADMIAAVDGAMRKKAQIFSPSKLFRKTGSYLGEGLVLGVSDWLGAADRMGDQIIDTISPTTLPQFSVAGVVGATGPVGYSGAVSAPISDRGRPVTNVTNNNTYQMTVSVKDVEEMVRLSRFVNDLPAGISMVFGSGGGA